MNPLDPKALAGNDLYLAMQASYMAFRASKFVVPNIVLLPAQYSASQIGMAGYVLGMRIIYACVESPQVAYL